MKPYLRCYNEGELEKDHPPFPFALSVVDGEDVEETCLRTPAVMRPDGPGAGLTPGLVAQHPQPVFRRPPCKLCTFHS